MRRARGEAMAARSATCPGAEGIAPSTRTFWVSPIPPKKTVPSVPKMANAGVAGAVVPTPRAARRRRGGPRRRPRGHRPNWPMSGRPVAKRLRLPTTSTRAAPAMRGRAPGVSTSRHGGDGRGAHGARGRRARRSRCRRRTRRRGCRQLGPSSASGSGRCAPGRPPALMGEAGEEGGEPGAAAHLELAHLLVGEPAVARTWSAASAAPFGATGSTTTPRRPPSPGPCHVRRGPRSPRRWRAAALGQHPDQLIVE